MFSVDESQDRKSIRSDLMHVQLNSNKLGTRDWWPSCTGVTQWQWCLRVVQHQSSNFTSANVATVCNAQLEC